ncbi:MAG: GTP 3',8-cyclase MoaA [Clostridia bacterium]
MMDQEGRSITYLRLSVTERCTLKCAYCRADAGLCPKQQELSAKEILRIVGVMNQLGIEKVRLTGGEPMLRRDLLEICAGIKALPGIRELAMTTNAQHLPDRAAELKAVGVDRLNISIDSLRPERYQAVTGGGKLQRVLDGIDAALAAGLLPVKLNAVIMRGTNDDEVDDFIALTRDRPIDMRFIELMPLGSVDHQAERITSDELIAARSYLVPVAPRYIGQPSVDYMVPGYLGRVGFISPMSHKFCGDCNRVRVMSDGMLRPCLGSNSEVSLKPALALPNDAELARVVSEAIWNKPHMHHFDHAFHTEKDMSRIGG